MKNGDPKKEAIAFVKNYFARQFDIREQEMV